MIQKNDHDMEAPLAGVSTTGEEQETQQSHLRAIGEALSHIDTNCHLAQDDIQQGDGYEVLEYVRNMRPWRRDARHHLAALGVTQDRQEVDP